MYYLHYNEECIDLAEYWHTWGLHHLISPGLGSALKIHFQHTHYLL